MKAISLYQPWASLVACGRKTVETRGWSTNYRGPLLICSTKTVPAKILNKATADPEIYGRAQCMPVGYLLHGVALAVVELLSCETAEAWLRNEASFEQFERIESEKAMGDLSPGRFAWRLGTPRLLPQKHAAGGIDTRTLIEVKGRQGLWTPPESVVKAVKAVSERLAANLAATQR